uniref:Ragulator complex protein LAMTOR2-B-like n=1 Tax=Phallusia mammillata TaxID=59560 RepID=A0A6F9DK74_9ASCI|nr:ragulator complex protein LAMTOR2-B-like [Phallusia mammillata]
MLNPADLTKMLNQANSGGIHTTLLVNSQGALVAFSGHGDSAVRIKATISSNIWLAYENSRHNAISDDGMHCFLASCEFGIIGVQKAGSSGVLLCMFADKTVGLGILRAKINTMATFLNGPLANIIAP